MAAPQLSVRSSNAKDLAHRLARRENRSIAEVVDRALEAHETREAGREPAANFYQRVNIQTATEIDLDQVICENRRLYHRIEL